METIGIVAVSLDGFITKHQDEGTAFTSEADKQFFRKVLREFDCSIFGAKTFLTSKEGILRHLTPDQLRIVLTRSPERYAAYQQTGLLEFSSRSPEQLLRELAQRQKTRCAVLGGGAVYTLFLATPLLDELWVTLEPRLFGTGKQLITEQGDVRLSLKSVDPLSHDTLLLKYTVLKP
ncbi:hypothetical protein GF339_01030 [candidate division KSB3 bacterium]|uniref:Bacterial bifunctional deaminase-reductase C-terminal domain-containing protein n=1 Tax=candidate division KSB3 bacterium TaxID=2044937 RepID=A0A9D5JRW6_9BACT|nr:hypothetical protein [candidate division KSB3 bacterium]MBD3323133.1 hypothetical protein [candidate division KSB3 bacterium]